MTEGGMDAELGDVTGSFATPVPRARSRSLRLGGSGLSGDVDGDGVREEDEEEEDVAALLDEGRADEQGLEDESDDKTVMFSQRSSFPSPVTHSLTYSPFSTPTPTHILPLPPLLPSQIHQLQSHRTQNLHRHRHHPQSRPPHPTSPRSQSIRTRRRRLLHHERRKKSLS